ncbi:MAG: nickel pincer cofactor biosynthesis protein LarC [Eubacteriales bacterium]
MVNTRKVLFFDCFAGASGDMILGALIDLGLDIEALQAELAKLLLKGYRIQARKVTKSGFSATKFDVIDETNGQLFDHAHAHHDNTCDQGHSHHGHSNDQHAHGHDHHHHGEEHHRHAHESCHEQRNLNDIVSMIEKSQLAGSVKEKSIRIFRRLAAAEAKIHGTVPEKIHFHEVGAVDAIVDIVGAAIALHLLQIDKIVVSPLPLGHGFVKCQHGTIPVPAPAAMELLTGMHTFGSEHNGEKVTPTGAAILSTLAETCGPMPALNVIKVGYGAGTREFTVPNLLRVILGHEITDNASVLNCDNEMVMELEANIDDMNPEFFDYVFEELFSKGALDVFLIPIQMKKNRPANMIKVLCREPNCTELAGVLFRETSTIGLRISTYQRLCLHREIVTVETEYGEIRVKQAILDGTVVNHAPEYEDCKKKAKEFNVPLKQVYNAAIKGLRIRDKSR